jgi:hypothetical protein
MAVMNSLATDEKFASLHRYYIWSLALKYQFKTIFPLPDDWPEQPHSNTFIRGNYGDICLTGMGVSM